MKLQDLLPAARPAPSRAARSASANASGNAPGDAPATDFADALSEARGKPKHKPATPDAPLAKEQATPEKPQGSEDLHPEEADTDVSAETAATTTADAGNEIDEPSTAEDENAESTAQPPAITADLSAVASAQPIGPVMIAPPPPPPQPPPQPPPDAPVASEADPEPAEATPRPICPPGKFLPGRMTSPGAEATRQPHAHGALHASLADESAIASPVGSTELVSDADNQPAAQGKVHEVPAEASAATTEQAATESSTEEIAALSITSAEAAGAAQAEPTRAGSAEARPAETVHTTQQVQTDAPRAARPAATPLPAPPTPQPAPQLHFVEHNHDKIVTAVRGELLPHGGTMQIRLDPPELGALLVSVRMEAGAMSAAFHTTSDDATRLLSHSLSQLKHALESQGVNVERLHVQQSPRDQQAANDDQRQGQQRDQQDDAHRQEQQRKEMLRRMWRKLSFGSDPLDLVA